MSKVTLRSAREKRTMAVRSKISGTADRPRLNVFRSNEHIYAQVIDDKKNETLAAASDLGKSYKGTKTNKAQQIAKDLLKQLKKKEITKLAFDRGPYRYHGRVKAVAEVLREEGIKI